MFGLGPLEILVILVFALLLFGRRLPEIGKGVGKSIVEFKKGLAGMEDELRIDGSSPNADASKTTAKKSGNQLDSNASASVDANASQQSSEKTPPSQS